MNIESMGEEQLRTLLENARRLLDEDPDNKRAHDMLVAIARQLDVFARQIQRRPDIN